MLPAPTTVGQRLREVVETVPARQAASQTAIGAPTSAMVRRPPLVSTRQIMDDQWDRAWQSEANRFAQILGPAAFAADVIADTCSRCALQIEVETDARTWEPDDDDDIQTALGEYRGEFVDQPDLIRSHARAYEVVGECAQVVTARSDNTGVSFGIFDWLAMRRLDADQKFTKGSFILPLVPGGRVQDGTAVQVAAENVWHMWLPDPQYPGRATSPFRGSLGALRRLWSLLRFAGRAVDHPLAMSKILVTDNESHRERVTNDDGSPGPSKLMNEYLDLASRAYANDDDIAGIAPPMFHTENPQAWKVLDLADALDPQLIAAIEAALREFAIGINMPASFLMGGGVGQDNHWSNWLTDQKFWESGPALLMRRICHYDLTVSVLPSLLEAVGVNDGKRRRIGFDAADVIIQPDHTELDWKMYTGGLLKGDRMLEAANYTDSDRMEDAERKAIGEFEAMKRGRLAGDLPGATVPGIGNIPNELPGKSSPSTTTKAPPSTNLSPGNQLSNDGAQAARTAAADDKVVTRAQVAKVLDRLHAIRQRLALAVKDKVDTAFAYAMHKADSKLTVRSNRREVDTSTRKAVQAALAKDLPRGPLLAAVGAAEADLLDRAFEPLLVDLRRTLAKGVTDLRRVISDAGFDPDRYLGDDVVNMDEALGYLQDAVRATAWQRLNAHHPFEPGPGEVAGDVPAGVVRNMFGTLFDELHVTSSGSGSEGPTVARTDTIPLEQELGAQIGFPIDTLLTPRADRAATELAPFMEWTWVHGYYGDPTHPLEPHQDLGWSGFMTTEPGGDLTPTTDPALANNDSFPESDYYSPGDHDGCTCEWVPHVVNDEEQP